MDIKNIKLSSLRKNIGQMLQDVFLFSGTIKSNIQMRDETITDEDGEEAIVPTITAPVCVVTVVPTVEDDIWRQARFGLTWNGFFLKSGDSTSTFEISTTNDLIITNNGNVRI